MPSVSSRGWYERSGCRAKPLLIFVGPGPPLPVLLCPPAERPQVPSSPEQAPLSGDLSGVAPACPLLPLSAEEEVEGLGHDGRGPRAAVSADVGGMITEPALCIRHDRSPRGNSEDLTIPFPSFSPQGLTVSNSTHNAGSQKARSDRWT